MEAQVLSYRKRLSMQAGGLSLLLSAILFLITGDVYSFVLVFAGILLGFSVGTALDKRKLGSIRDMGSSSQAASTSSFTAAFRRTLLSRSLLVRFISLLVAGTLIFLAVWYAGYYLLPEGIISTGAPAGEGAAPNVYQEFFTIVGYNLMVMAAILAIGVLLPQYPFAYMIPLVWCALYGLLLGTNSFVIPMAERMAPSFAVFERAGPFELAAYLLAAAAAYSPARRGVTKVREALKTPISRAQLFGIVLAVLMILGAAYREALMILAAS